MSKNILVELAFAAPDAQSIREVVVPGGATVADAIEASRLQEEFPDYSFAELPVGIWGQQVAADQRLQDGDRIEIYRKLLLDPMEARRLRASAPDPGPRESR